MRKFAVILALGLVTAVSPASAKRDHSVPVATPNGKPVSCISLTSIRESRVRSDSIIDFKTNGNKWYRNTLPNSCPSLGFEERFAYKTSLNQLCSVDIITVLQSPGISRGASCGLGQFQPVELAKR